jgi:hypothetical protein
MAEQIVADIAFRRGPTSERIIRTFSEGTPIWDMTSKELYVGDGETQGGVLLAGLSSTSITNITSNTGTTTLSSDSLTATTLNVTSNISSTLILGSASATDKFIQLDWSEADGPRLLAEDLDSSLKFIYNKITALEIGNNGSVFPNGVNNLTVRTTENNTQALLVDGDTRDQDPTVMIRGFSGCTLAMHTNYLRGLNTLPKYLSAEGLDPNFNYASSYNIGVGTPGGTYSGSWSVGHIQSSPFLPLTGFSGVTYNLISGIGTFTFTLSGGDATKLRNIKAGENMRFGNWTGDAALTPSLSGGVSGWNGIVLTVLSSNSANDEIIAFAGDDEHDPLFDNILSAGNLPYLSAYRTATYTLFEYGSRNASMVNNIDDNPANFDEQLRHTRFLVNQLPVVSASNINDLDFVHSWQIYADTDGILRINLPPLVREATTGDIVTPDGALTLVQDLASNPDLSGTGNLPPEWTVAH